MLAGSLALSLAFIRKKERTLEFVLSTWATRLISKGQPEIVLDRDRDRDRDKTMSLQSLSVTVHKTSHSPVTTVTKST